jgi:type II secretory pathway pseudopilin PulG
MAIQANKRHAYVMKDFLVPIAVALILGALASFATTKYVAGSNEIRLQTLERQMIALEVIFKAVQTNQIELAARGAWMVSTERRIKDNETKLTELEASTYKIKDAERDNYNILREIKLRHGEES